MKALIVFATLVLAQIVSASAQDVAQAGLPERQVGDKWEYSYLDTNRNRPSSTFSVTVTETTASGGFTVDIDGRKTTFEEGRGITTSVKSVSFSFPLKVGDKKSYKTSEDIQGSHWDYTVVSEVVAIEEVDVPAGTFEAFKIRFVNEYVGSSGGSSWRGTVTDTWWYAPSAKNFVRRTFSDSGGQTGSKPVIRELVKYQLK